MLLRGQGGSARARACADVSRVVVLLRGAGVGLAIATAGSDGLADEFHPANLVMMVDEPTFGALELRLGQAEDIPKEAVPLCRYRNIMPNMASIVKLTPRMVRGKPVRRGLGALHRIGGQPALLGGLQKQ
jgi:hypothetical protein